MRAFVSWDGNPAHDWGIEPGELSPAVHRGGTLLYAAYPLVIGTDRLEQDLAAERLRCGGLAAGRIGRRSPPVALPVEPQRKRRVVNRMNRAEWRSLRKCCGFRNDIPRIHEPDV